ncbi:deoxynucleoside kinase [Limibacter armeniacum]|uniref:deoxynucleoside kinase n=1 Tax=Limibacter armeniacum TaxID=466084 RepID=UPI002FE55069
MYIAVAGNIGSGKTTLTTKLAERFGWEPEFESTDANPYLEDFYHDMPRWAFHLQVQFLNNSFRQVNDITNRNKPVIQDRSIYENAHIFAKNLHVSGIMDDRDFSNYQHLFELMASYVKVPDLLIYLKADTSRLHEQIIKRGRDYEQDIPKDYLNNLNNLYDQWISDYNWGELLVVEMTSIDFVENQQDFELIAAQVEERLHKLA